MDLNLAEKATKLKYTIIETTEPDTVNREGYWKIIGKNEQKRLFFKYSLCVLSNPTPLRRVECGD